ncbi:aspartate carbamoyltransferase [Hypnocyclicus thermotrophus]|uniref:Aspartate carbamoyltransferase n=1 Tax=Hypnocyclicus thermotrophus TaxID=1627895 RepID=A0AA46DXH2_9FUSO|nr:aspartate carbamoyltransferase [Hypnocyclicus thermotrophus]TDT67405.1 aspartate carbamoyltransferase [Hypnocyclicus thermotrophus]
MYKSRKDIISLNDLTKEEIEHILDTAEYIENNPNNELLKGYIVSTLFFEPSTRTRLSFWSAAQRLGAQVLGFDSPAGTSKSKGESLADTIRMAEAYSDIIIIRHPNDGSAKLASEISKIPIINAGDGANQHPTQTLLDLYTIKKERGNLDNIKIAFVGDLKYGRTVHSLARALSHFNTTFYFVAPDNLQMPKYILKELEKLNIKYESMNNYNEILSKIDFFYMTRIQRERFPDDEEYQKVKGIYIINKEIIEKANNKNLRILHPLPRVDEIDIDLDNTIYAKYFEQAKNGVPVRQALLALSLNKLDKLGD